MPEYILKPGPVTSAETSFRPPAVIVGDPPQWADGSDATYATAKTDTATENASKPIATVPTGHVVGRPILFNVLFRVASTDTSMVQIGATNNPDLQGSQFHDITADGAPRDYEATFYFGLDDPAAGDDVAAGFARGSFDVYVGAVESSTHAGDEATFYEVTFRVITEGVTGLPPLRQYPRDDELGTASARRIWPTSSHQASSRRLGGYY